MDLFEHARDRHLEEKAPLAARMRPRTLEEFVGQEHALGPGRLLRRAIQADQLSSIIFYGPPGTGKTTLARIIANTTQAHFHSINAVLAGVADIRKAVAGAEERLGAHGRRTILFVDEVHRFNKAQQDALLPHVENGTLVLVGATTENPYFEVNKALVSRSRIFQLKPLEPHHLEDLLGRALADAHRGYGGRKVAITPEAMAHLAQVANGDARAALNALELAAETTEPAADGAITITLEVAEESIQQKAVLYDKDGDAHFDAISAFIKSMRGSDADAALYWMARMVYAGEDPRFILRRMLIFAAEDVGLADPDALRVVADAARAFDYVGMPEGRFLLAQACLYLATAPKSNSTFAFFDALDSVHREKAEDVPDHLKDASRDGQGLGHGQGYLYPHAYRDHWVAQQYLPDGLQGRVFYQPGDLGFEGRLQERVQHMREANMAAAREDALPGMQSTEGAGGAQTSGRAAWEARGQGDLAQHLHQLRTRLFEMAAVGREDLVLDARAGTGLLTLEATRRAVAGGVWARVEGPEEARALADAATLLPALDAPVIVDAPLEKLEETIRAGHGEPPRFDLVLGRNLLGALEDEAGRVETLRRLAGWLAPGGRVALAEGAPALSGGVLAGVDWRGAPPDLREAALAAEAAWQAAQPHLQWEEAHLRAWLEAAGLHVRHIETWRSMVEYPITRAMLTRWFGAGENTADTTGGTLGPHLGEHGPPLRNWLTANRMGQTLRRRNATLLALASS